MGEFGRRKGDSMENKILRIAATVGALGTIGFFASNLGSLRFADKDKNETTHQEIKMEAQKDRGEVALMRKDIVTIKDGIEDIKKKLP